MCRPSLPIVIAHRMRKQGAAYTGCKSEKPSLTRSFEGLNYIPHRANSLSVSSLAITHIYEYVLNIMFLILIRIILKDLKDTSYLLNY
jgi:hypothetical protein